MFDRNTEGRGSCSEERILRKKVLIQTLDWGKLSGGTGCHWRREEFLITSGGSLKQEKDPGHRGATGEERSGKQSSKGWRYSPRVGDTQQRWLPGEERAESDLLQNKTNQKQNINQPYVPRTNPSLRKICVSAASLPPFPVQTEVGHN